MENVTYNTTLTPDKPSLSAGRIVLCWFLLAITVITIGANAVVLLAFTLEKKLRTTFTIYIANLAVTDLSVGLFAMSFYTFDVFLGYWPFGEFICGLWIFFDYGMTFASVFTLVAISVDRFWSVTWHVHYRAKNNKKKGIIAVLIVWFASLTIWLPPFVYDRIKWSEPGVCNWDPSNNSEFVVFVAIIGYHGPCILLLFCYLKMFHRLQKRQQIRTTPPSTSTSNSHPTEESTDSTAQSESHPVQKVFVTPYRQPVVPEDSIEGDHSTSSQTPGMSNEVARTPKNFDKEKKIFVTLTYIIFSYLICWVPFHIIFDVSAIRPDLVSEELYAVGIWLAYFNSTINPFLFAYSSTEFRKAFTKVMKCSYCRK